MTPKEKAKELVYKYRYLVTIWDCYNDCDIKIKDRLPDMKQCALIAVDELIKTEYETVKKLLEVIESKNIRLVMSFNKDYWQEVKQEIEKL
jgi:hypothetical protein